MNEERPNAVVLGVQLGDVDDIEFESSLMELERLATTLGLQPIGRVTQRRSGLAASTVLGQGKLLELAAWTGGTGTIPTRAKQKKRKIDATDDDEVDEGFEGFEEEEAATPSSFDAPTRRAKVVLVDHDISPSQARNLEIATGAEVLDRTSVILSIFQRHARTREARLQVEIARLVYLAPRLRESGGGSERQRGGIGGKGAGESSVELDRRKIRDRIAELRAELSNIERESSVRRKRRSEADTVALVGYTNAGKSSWMRRLTGGEVYVADKLFATLDTTVRTLLPETRPRILVSDTVGFIKKLPHDLVASFRSTLDEARDASLLLHVVDASDPAFRSQYDVTRSVLAELGANEAPSALVLNKIDRVDADERAALAREFPDAVQVSARDDEDVGRLHAYIVAFFERDMRDEDVLVPYHKQALVNRYHEAARVLEERYEDDGTHLAVRGRPADLDALRRELG